MPGEATYPSPTTRLLVLPKLLAPCREILDIFLAMHPWIGKSVPRVNPLNIQGFTALPAYLWLHPTIISYVLNVVLFWIQVSLSLSLSLREFIQITFYLYVLLLLVYTVLMSNGDLNISNHRAICCGVLAGLSSPQCHLVNHSHLALHPSMMWTPRLGLGHHFC